MQPVRERYVVVVVLRLADWVIYPIYQHYAPRTVHFPAAQLPLGIS